MSVEDAAFRTWLGQELHDSGGELCRDLKAPLDIDPYSRIKAETVILGAHFLVHDGLIRHH